MAKNIDETWKDYLGDNPSPLKKRIADNYIKAGMTYEDMKKGLAPDPKRLAKITKSNPVSPDNVQKSQAKLSKEVAAYYKDYLKGVKEKTKQWLETYDELSFSKKLEVEQLLGIQAQLENLMGETVTNVAETIKAHTFKQGAQAYNSVWYQLEQAYNLNLDFSPLDENYLNALVTAPVGDKLTTYVNGDWINALIDQRVGGKTFDQRMIRDLKQLRADTKDAITRGFLNGDSYERIAGYLNTITSESYKSALRIARTEGGRVQSEATQKGYEQASEQGIDLKKRWLATLDGRTRHDHGALDGQTVLIKEQFTVRGYTADAPRMFGIASEDINCRCTTVPIVDDIAPELRVDNETGEMIDWQTYDDWKKAKGKVDKDDTSSLFDAKGIIGKTNFEEQFGAERTKLFIEDLQAVTDSKQKELYVLFGSDIPFIKHSESYQWRGEVYLNNEAFTGNRIHSPNETVFHENGHWFDKKGLELLTGGEDVILSTTKAKKKIGKFVIEYDKNEFARNASELPKYDLKNKIKDDLWRYINGDLEKMEWSDKPRRNSKAFKEWDKKWNEFYAKSKENQATFERRMNALRDKNPYLLAVISDIYEGSGMTINSTPFGSGHGLSYWKDHGMLEAEFVAHISEKLGKNDAQSLNALKQIFPNAINTYDDMISDIIKVAKGG